MSRITHTRVLGNWSHTTPHTPRSHILSEDGLVDAGDFGVCPECRRNDGYINVHKAHWYMCHAHQTKWCAGWNLFSTWKRETESDWEENNRLLRGYREVEPIYAA